MNVLWCCEMYGALSRPLFPLVFPQRGAASRLNCGSRAAEMCSADVSLSLSLSTLTMRPQGYGVDLLPIVFRPDTWGLHSTRVSRNDAPAVFPPLHEQSVSQGFPPGRTFFTFGLLQAEDIKHSLIFYSLQTRLLKSIHTYMYLKAW